MKNAHVEIDAKDDEIRKLSKDIPKFKGRISSLESELKSLKGEDVPDAVEKIDNEA